MFNDKISRIAFFISLSGHLLLLLGVPELNLPSFRVEIPEEITVRIEIEKPPLLPKIDVMGEEKKLKSEDREQMTENRKKQIPKEEVVLERSPKEPIEEKVEVIDPAQEAMLRYQDMVKQRIEEVRRYPYWAKEQGIEGTVYISFIVLSNGLSRDVKIVHSSGFSILDSEATATIKRANPFPPLPAEINRSSVQMEVSIVFKLK